MPEKMKITVKYFNEINIIIFSKVTGPDVSIGEIFILLKGLNFMP